MVRRIRVAQAIGVLGAFGSIWASGGPGVVRIDPATNTIVQTVPVTNASWLAASDDAVWVVGGGGLVRIDPATNTVVATIPLPSSPLGDPAVVAGQVWVPEISQNAVAIVDAGTNSLSTTVKVGRGPFVVTEIRGEAWIPSWKGADIWRLRP